MPDQPPTVAGLGADHVVRCWDSKQSKWYDIGSIADSLYGGAFALLATGPSNDDVSAWVRASNWIKIGEGGAKFVVTPDSIFGIAPGHSAVYKWIPCTLGELIGGGKGTLYGINPDNGDIWRWSDKTKK